MALEWTVAGRAARTLWIQQFVADLAAVPSGEGFVNFYSPDVSGSDTRRHNLTLYLEQMDARDPSVLLVGEAPGHRGTRVTGVPFADHLLVASGVPELSMLGTARGYRLPITHTHPRKEQTSTVVWRTLSMHGFTPLLWAVFPFHPFGERGPDSNRRPRPSEIEIGQQFLTRLLDAWEIHRLVALGRVAEQTLKRLGFSPQHIRHPARGGQHQFEHGIAALIDENTALHAA
jgi:uracil-DNA glycosylase